VVIPHGVSVDRFEPTDAGDGPPWRLIQVASLNRVKDQRTLVRAVRLLKDRGVRLHLDHVGEDTLDGAVQAQAADLRIADAITFHGFQPTDRVAALCRASHLFVSSSRHEGSGVAALEAAACGVPTVGSAVGYVADWMPDAAAGVPPGDANALADAIRLVLEDPARRRRMGAAARAWALAHDADAMAGAFDDLYRRAASR